MNLMRALLCSMLTASLGLTQVNLDVVYPRYDDEGNPPKIDRVDSTFVFGSVNPPFCPVMVNGVGATVYHNGAFMAWVPVNYTDNNFKIYACNGEDEVEILLPFEIRTKAEIQTIISKLPITLEVVNPNAVMRYSANNGVYHMFPSKGALLSAINTHDNFYQVRLNSQESVWIESRFVKERADIPIKKVRRIHSVEVIDSPNVASLIVPCKNFPPHKVEEEIEPTALQLYLYGIESHIDLIKNPSTFIREIRWKQLDSETLRLTIIPECQQLWGYRAKYDSTGNFIFAIKKPPKLKLKDLRIAIDPGHGGEEIGAIGPTRLEEKKINLLLAQKLKTLLDKKGARTFLTRDDDTTIDLYQRMEAADDWGADIFISIHNNALADGIYPFDRRGCSVYYYHPRSVDLGRSIHYNLLKNTGLPNDGFNYGNLAVPRTTYMPAVLVETAYIMHPVDEMMLRDQKMQKRIAEGIFNGVIEFIKHRKNLCR